MPMGATGLEHLTKTPGKRSNPETGGAESGAVADEIGPIDPDLQRIVEAWPRLPETIRSTIMGLFETTDQSSNS